MEVNDVNWNAGYNVFLDFKLLYVSRRHSSSLHNFQIPTTFLKPYVDVEEFTRK